MFIMLRVNERKGLVLDEISSEITHKSWGMLVLTENNSTDNAVVLIAVTTDFIEQFAVLTINEAEIHDWFNEDGPGYEHLNGQGIVELTTVTENVEEVEDAKVITHFEV